MAKRLFIVDAYALIYRYYYAFMGRPMRNRDGLNTSVVFGFTKFLRDLLKREKPDLIGVAFDPHGGSFRREIFPEYKANRPPTPEDIKISLPYVKRLLEAMCIPILEVPGFEADDVVGTLAKQGAKRGYSVYMVTPDKDYSQLVDDSCVVYYPKGDEIKIIDRAAIEEKYGFDDPVLVRDILALWGDASDNIPGVPGIGEKGAAKPVREWGTVENILANTDKIGGKTGKNIAEWGDKLRLAKELTTIRLDAPIELDEASLTMSLPKLYRATSTVCRVELLIVPTRLGEYGPRRAYTLCTAKRHRKHSYRRWHDKRPRPSAALSSRVKATSLPCSMPLP